MFRLGTAIAAISSIFFHFFPVFWLKRVNNVLDQKIDNLKNGSRKFSYMKGYETLNLSDAQKFLDKTFEARKTIEDKAKINMLGVTISVSLIIGLSQIFDKHDLFLGPPFIRFLSALLAFYSLSSMLVSTALSLLILGRLNVIYDLYPPDKILETDAEKVDIIAVNAELNMNYNIKRNNYLYLSYHHIINSLLGLFLLFLVVIVPHYGDYRDIPSESFKKVQEDIQEIKKDIHKLKETRADTFANVEKRVQSLERRLTEHPEKIKTLERDHENNRPSH